MQLLESHQRRFDALGVPMVLQRHGAGKQLNGRGLHASGASNRHGADTEIDLVNPRIVEHTSAAFRDSAKDVVRVAVQEKGIGGSGHLHGFLTGRNDERRLATLGNGQE